MKQYARISLKNLGEGGRTWVGTDTKLVVWKGGLGWHSLLDQCLFKDVKNKHFIINIRHKMWTIVGFERTIQIKHKSLIANRIYHL